MSVDGSDDTADGDKSISSLLLKKSNDQSVELKVYFADRKALSQYIAEPDILIVKISLPQYLRDKETGQMVELDSGERRVKIKPQYSEQEFAELLEQVENAI